MANISTLPAEILDYIFSYVRQPNRSLLALVCQAWKSLAGGKSGPATDYGYGEYSALSPMDWAVWKDEGQLVSWALANYTPKITPRRQPSNWVDKIALQRGTTEMVDRLSAAGVLFCECPLNWDYAATRRDVAFVQRVYADRREKDYLSWSEDTCEEAAKHGNLAVLQWLRSRPTPCPWFKLECGNAARKGGHKATEAWVAAQDW
jgi:hypothetical protein